MIAVRHVELRVEARTLLRDLSFDVSPGEFVAILGANGVGKTTLLRAIAGVRAPDSGSITIDGRDVASFDPAARALRMAHIAGDDLFIDRLTVRDVVAMGRYSHHRWWQWHSEPRDDESIDAALGAVHMSAFANRLFDTLSSGERQRIWLALALAQEAPLLLLDEPTSHLDVRVAHDILALLRTQVARGKSVVCVLHDLNEAAQFADRILLLGPGGAIACDAPQAALQPNLLERAYGIEMEAFRSPSGALRVFPKRF